MASQVLYVELVEAKDLLPPKANSASTAFFCNVGVGGVRKKSKTIRNSLEPRWEQSFEFDVEGSDLPSCVITMQDKGLFGSTSMGQITIKTAKKLAGTKENDSWYPLQPSKSGKAANGALHIKLKLMKKNPSLAAVSGLSKKKSSVLTLSQPAGDVFRFIDNNDWVGLDEFLEKATPDQVNIQENKTLNSPLHIACLQCKSIDERIIETLLNYEKIKVDVMNVDRNTPLYYFCAKWQLPDIRFLEKMIKLGADVNSRNVNGETPIFAAIFNESIRSLLLETLIEHGADVNVISVHGESILHYAVRLGRFVVSHVPRSSSRNSLLFDFSDDLVNVILTASPRLDVKGKDGMTPYQVALHYKFKGIPRQLKKAEDLFNWLEKNDLAEFKGIFLKNEIYKNLLADISEGLLDKMGVEDGPSRKKILEACRRLEREEAEPDVLADDDNPGMDETKTAQLKQDLAALSPESQGSDGSNNQDWILDGKELEYLKRLGSGTSGDVYKGLYRGKHCAIKVLKEMTEDKEREEFKKEFHIMSAVHHPNIVRFFGASFKPKLCMVLEFCARGSLYHVLKDETNTINWERGLQIMKETVAGIDALHGNEPMIMHRDLKSLNLLVTDDWHIKVADFGLSRFDTAEALETLKQMRGTFAYCAPESYHGEKYSPKSDIYSMGIIFWELANRIIKCKYEQPYSEFKNIQFDFQIIIQAAKSDLRPTIPPSCPALIADVIRVCTHKERDERPDCKALLTMIESCLSDYHANAAKWEGTIVGTK